MDKTIPAGAAILLRFIYKTEVSREAPECYDVIYGHNQRKLGQPLTSMTIAEVQSAQSAWSRNFGSSAAGAYQFMRDTLRDLTLELKLSNTMLFTGDLQDRLGYHLLKRRGYNEFLTGKIGRTEFAKRLAQEWASFPVLAATKGAKRAISRGQSYYSGDGLNNALVKPEAVEEILNQVLAAGNRNQDKVLGAAEPQPDPVTHIVVDAVNPADKPPLPKTSTPVVDVTTILTVIASALIGAATGLTWFSNMPCSWLGVACGN